MNEQLQLQSKNLFELEFSLANPLFDKYLYPWEVLPFISEYILELGKTLDPAIYKQKEGEHIWVAKSAQIASSAFLNGPLIIGPDTEIRHCAFIRGSALIGASCVIGNSTELKNVILFDSVQVPHYNYVGDSILGYKSHMGAGAIISNVKADKSQVVVHTRTEIKSHLKKFGAILGDFVEIGCNSVLNPGSIIGKNSNVYPTSMVRGFIPPNRIYKNAIEIVPKK